MRLIARRDRGRKSPIASELYPTVLQARGEGRRKGEVGEGHTDGSQAVFGNVSEGQVPVGPVERANGVQDEPVHNYGQAEHTSTHKDNTNDGTCPTRSIVLTKRQCTRVHIPGHRPDLRLEEESGNQQTQPDFQTKNASMNVFLKQ